MQYSHIRIFTNLVYSSPRTLRTNEYSKTCQICMMGRFIPEHWYIQNSRLIQNPVKYPWWRILFRKMCNPSIFRSLAYSESKAYSEYYQTSIMKYFNNNYSKFRCPIYSKLSHIQNLSVCIHYSLLKVWPTTIQCFSHSVWATVITLSIILRNEIPGNNDLFKFTA